MTAVVPSAPHRDEPNPDAPTLGEIRDALDELVKKGAHPGSIHWVLRHKLDHDCGDCDLCDCRKTNIHGTIKPYPAQDAYDRQAEAFNQRDSLLSSGGLS